MLANSLQIRRSAIAYLFQTGLGLDRRDNMEFYDAITAEGVELPQMQQSPKELVLLHQRAPDQGFEVRVGAMQVQAPPGIAVNAPFRLLVAETGSPKPVQFFSEAADSVFGAFRKIWKDRYGQLQMVEVSVFGTLSADPDPGGAAAFIRERALMGDEAIRRTLGREFGQFGFKLSSPMFLAVPPGTNLPLQGAQLELTVESLMNDPKLIGITLLAKWQRIEVPVRGAQLPPEVRSAMGGRDVLELNTEPREPREYLTPVYEYFTDNVARFVANPGR